MSLSFFVHVFVHLSVCVSELNNWAAKLTGFTLEIVESLPVDSDQNLT